MKTATHIFILFFLLLTASNIAFAQEKKGTSKKNKTEHIDKHTFTNTTVHDISPISMGFIYKQTAPISKITSIISGHKVISTVQDTVIVKGSEVKIAFKFDKSIYYFEIVGVGRASKADIQSGKWEVVLTPQKTTIYQYNFRGHKMSRITRNPYLGILVIVVNSETEIEEAWRKYNEGLATQSSDWKRKFL